MCTKVITFISATLHKNDKCFYNGVLVLSLKIDNFVTILFYNNSSGWKKGDLSEADLAQ